MSNKKKNNNIHYLFINIYSKLRRLLFSILYRLGNFHSFKKSTESDILKYWEIKYGDRCRYSSDKIINLKPHSVLEIGCNCGNNLVVPAQTLTKSIFVGIDSDINAVTLGNKLLNSLGIENVTLKHGDAGKLTRFDSKSFELVFTYATLMYVRPSQIMDVLQNIFSIATKYVLIIEMHSNNLTGIVNRYGKFYNPHNWKRNYVKLIDLLNIHFSNLSIDKLPQNIWQPNGGDATCLCYYL